MPRHPTLVALLPIALAAPLAHAQGVATQRFVALDTAVQIAAASVAACQAKGFAVTTTVVDRAGGVRAVLRANNAGPHTLGSAERKAFTAASLGIPSGVAMENAAKNPAAAHLGQIPGLILLAGGVPVKIGNETVAGVGVGGAPSGAIDEECALAGIEKVRDQLK